MKTCRYCSEQELKKDLKYGNDAVNKNRTITLNCKSYIYAHYYCENCGYSEMYRELYDRDEYETDSETVSSENGFYVHGTGINK